ncbi:MAG: hypothetical protein J1E83_14270 [Lachnospiraceae bacterium]|nr:hypothetical protein [Lachnospiraceae bacterium]
MSQEGNDFYITGADAVRKKLGESTTLIKLGTYFNQSSATITIPSEYNPSQLTEDNFILKLTGMPMQSVTAPGAGGDYPGTGGISGADAFYGSKPPIKFTLSYNSTILTVGINGYVIGTAGYKAAARLVADFNVWLVVGGKPTD